MGRFTLHCVPFLFDFLKSYLEFKSRLTIPELYREIKAELKNTLIIHPAYDPC